MVTGIHQNVKNQYMKQALLRQKPHPNTKPSTGSLKLHQPISEDTIDIATEEKVPKRKKHLGWKIAGVVALAASTTSAIAMLGVNPAKAAKVLRGTISKMDVPYQKGGEILDDILKKSGNFNTSYDGIMKLFNPSKGQSPIVDSLDELIEVSKKIDIPEDIMKSTNELRDDSAKFADAINKKLGLGDDIDIYKEAEKFQKKNKDKLQQINEELKKHLYRDDLDEELVNQIRGIELNISPYSLYSQNFHPHANIADCPEELLPKDGIYYHGTPKAKTVFKEGLSPFKSKQINDAAREMGAGVYLTPDADVAKYFASTYGQVIPYKVDAKKIALITDENHNSLSKAINNFLNERAPELLTSKTPESNAITELMYRKVLQDAGYDAVYIPKGVKSGGLLNIFMGDINEAIGKKQSQLVVFDPDLIEVQSRNFKERKEDIIRKYKNVCQQIKYAKEHPFGF